jgi:Tol biopolymer transport system component
VVVAALAPIVAGCGSQPVPFLTEDVGPAWSPRGGLIAFMTTRGGGGIDLVRPNGTGLRQVFQGQVDGDRLAWSPDGRRLAFEGREGVYVLRLGAGPPTRILGRAFHSPAWSPDGRRLVVEHWARPWDVSRLFVAAADSGRTLRVVGGVKRRCGCPATGTSTGEGGVHQLSPAELDEFAPTWSPNGREIAFETGDGEIAVESLADRRSRIIVPEGGYQPAWSPNGRLIAFECSGNVCVVPSDGSGEIRKLASDAGSPSWSPDSRHIVFERFLCCADFTRSPTSLSIIDADGQGSRVLTYGPNRPAQAH